MDMSIATMSVSMHQAQAGQEFGVAVLKMAMDTVGDTAELLDTAVESLDPALGANIDIQA